MASPVSSRSHHLSARSSLLFGTTAKFHPEFAAGVSIVVIAVAVVVLLAIVQIARRGPSEQEVTADGDGLFCCPEDMRETLRYINTSANPCRDFFAYVCSGVVSNRLWPEYSSQAEFESMVFTGVMPPGAPRSPAGEFLVQYHRSCLESIVRRNISRELAAALVRKEQGVLKNMDAKKAFIYATTATVKYRLNAAFYVLQRLKSDTASVGTALICTKDDSYTRKTLKASVDTINSILNLEATVHKTLELKANICSISHAHRWEIVKYTAANQSDFQRRVWNIDDLEAGLVANGLSLATVQFLVVKQWTAIRAILEVFSRERNDSSTGATYLLWHSVMSGVLKFELSIGRSPQRLFEVCKKQVSDVWQLGRIFKINIFTNPAKDARLHAIFDNVKDAVRADLLRSGLVAPDDQNRLEQFFGGLTLITPAEAVNAGLPLPKVSSDFASSLLEALAFDYEAGNAYFANFDEKYTRSFIYLRINGNRSMYITTKLYYFVQTGKGNFELSNMATVGRILAEALWFMLFRAVTWASQTKANMWRLEECYDSLYWSNSSGRNTDAITSFFISLGLSSVLNAFHRPQWLTVKPAWGFWRMSHSQLFYIISTYARCPRTSTAKHVNIINAPLKFIADFEDAFKCPPGAPMTKRQACSLPAL